MTSDLCATFARVRRDRSARLAIHGLSEHRAVTFEALGAEADAVAAALDAARLPPRAIVIVLVGNRTAFVSTILACRQRDLVVVPLDGDSTMAEALSLADRFGAAALVVRRELAFDRGRASSLPNGCVLLRPTDDPARRQQSGHAAWVFDPDVAFFKLTSGSTSMPKAVMVSEANLIADGLQIVEAMGIGPGDVNIAAIPLSHSYGMGNLLMPLLLQGSPIVLRDAFAPSRLFDDIRESGATVMPGVPFMFEYIRQHLAGSRFPASMRALISAGARLDPATLVAFKDAFGLKIHSFYGTSETGGIAYDDSDAVSDPLTVGRPLPHVQVEFRELLGGLSGEGRLHVRSAAVARGYAGDWEETASSFVDGGFLTGDVGYADAAGRLILTGRVSRFVNVAGRKVHPDEVARVLRGYAGVSDAKVFGVPDPARGQTLVACVVGDPAHVDVVGLRRHCAASLSAYKIPRHIVVLRALPVDARGKTDQRALEELVRGGGQ